MEIQQHDGVVVDVAGSRQGFAKLLREGEVLQGRREALKAVVLLPSLPPLYRPLGGCAGPGRWDLQGGAAAKGGRGCLAPQGKGGAPTPRVSNPRRRGGPRGAHQPTRGWFPSHFSPWGPPRLVAPPSGPRDPSGGPGTIPVTPETFPMAETGLPIYKSLPPDHSGTAY